MTSNDRESMVSRNPLRTLLVTGILLAGLLPAGPASAHPAGHNSTAELLFEPFGPLGWRDTEWDLHFRVDGTFAGHCTQNDGRGTFETLRGENGHGETYTRKYWCAYLLITDGQLTEHSGAHQHHFTRISHDFNDRGRGVDPHFANPDKNHRRYRNEWCVGGDCRISALPSVFYPGTSMADFYYEPGPHDGWYYSLDVYCDPAPPGGTASLADLDRFCSEDKLLRIATDKTRGPTRILALGDTYDPYGEHDHHG
jgi:hypothetical protein